MCDSASPAAWNAASISAQVCARCQDPINSVVGASVDDALVGSVVITSDAELESSPHPAAIVRLRTMLITMRLLNCAPLWPMHIVPRSGVRVHGHHGDTPRMSRGRRRILLCLLRARREGPGDALVDGSRFLAECAYLVADHRVGR
jgi:hypothetical protein